jgi:integrase
MPRKPKREKKTITVIVNGTPVAVILHPPNGRRTSWFAYWNGLVASRSTGQSNFEDAVVVAENMVKNGGQQPVLADAVLSDEEFEEIQRRHYGKKTDPLAKSRAAKTLEDCLDAISAFRAISGLKPVTIAMPADCERFQEQALKTPKNWRHLGKMTKAGPGDSDRQAVETLSPNTILKWCRQLQAAFERANRRATRRKCVRSVVDESKLLESNPWSQITWIEGRNRPIRHFSSEDLLAFLDYLETGWAAVPVGAAAAKVFLWSSCRKLEVASLQWHTFRVVGEEHHFQIIGKWGVERWFRVPEALYRDLLAMKTTSPFVFAAYNRQLRQCHADNPNALQLIKDKFNPRDFGRWFYQRVRDWSAEAMDEPAFVHMFRKTTLQYARRGEDINRQVAQDARVSETVMMTNYVKESDEELRQRSNRTYHRIVASLAPEVAARYGYVETAKSDLERALEAAVAAQNWDLAQALSARLASKRHEASE